MNAVWFFLGCILLGSPAYHLREMGSRWLRYGDWDTVFRFAISHPDGESRRRLLIEHHRRSTRFMSRLYPAGDPLTGPCLSRSFLWYTLGEEHLDRLAFDGQQYAYPDRSFSHNEELHGARWNLVGSYTPGFLWGAAFYDSRWPRFPDGDPVALYLWTLREIRACGPRSIPRIVAAHLFASIPRLSHKVSYYDEEPCP